MDGINYDSLIIDSANGDMSALEILYDNLHKGIFTLALSITKDYSLSEDIVQETFIKVKISGSSLIRQGQGKAWVYRIARNLALNMKKSSERLVSMTDMLENTTADADMKDAGSDELRSQAQSVSDRVVESILLENALKTLSLVERQIVMLHAVTGMLHSEIAKILSIPEGTVKWKYRRSLKRLNKFYHESEVKVGCIPG